MTSVALPVVDINEELPNLKKKRGFLGDSMQKMENSKKRKNSQFWVYIAKLNSGKLKTN